eukprot:6195281-Pleurochrysis_carterae.AAC.8
MNGGRKGCTDEDAASSLCQTSTIPSMRGGEGMLPGLRQQDSQDSVGASTSEGLHYGSRLNGCLRVL